MAGEPAHHDGAVRISLAGMPATFDDIHLIGPPAADGEYVALDEHEVVHLHDYPRIYAVPGLYEHVVQERLACRSPQVAADGFLRAGMPCAASLC